MDFYGNINLKDNEIQNLVFEQETSFPIDATVGSIVFKDSTLYMCVALNVADPIWIPLTASIDTYVHEQEATSTTWTVTHNLGEENLILQVYNDTNEMVIPDTVTPTDTNEIIVTFSTAIAGRVIVMFGDTIPANGIGIIDPITQAIFNYTLDNPTDYLTDSNDNFGYAVAISGNYCTAGAIHEDVSGDGSSGRAYIFNVTTGALVHTLDNPNAYGTDYQDYFGSAIDMDGNNIIIGTWAEDDAGGTDSGKAYIFDATTGALLRTLDNPNAYNVSTSDQFGYSVSISGDNAIIGAHYEDDASGNTVGVVYIFNITNGALLHTLYNPNADGVAAGDIFGHTVSIDGNNAIVGASGDDDGANLNSGRAYIFNVTTGALVHTLDNPNVYGTSWADSFGDGVGISGNNAIVGARQENDEVGHDSGKAYIFNVTTGALLHTLDNPNPTSNSYDEFGFSVSMSGNKAIIGGHDAFDGVNTSGKSYIFNVTTGALLYTIDNPNPTNNDQFGYAVGIDGDNVIVGAFEEAGAYNGAGKAYLYTV